MPARKYRPFSENLRMCRERAGLTQEELARNMELHKSVISHYECERRIPRIDTLIDLCLVLGVQPNALLQVPPY